ncbi:MAG: hypothetical protein KAI69_01085, partial [Deltaproteobacteria bacterium]|nr:hypothetical protein [Deltaproteobacteria bacterium]
DFLRRHQICLFLKYSVRSNKAVLFRLITDAHNFGGIKVVVVCRTFDLDSDPRLKSLKEANRTKTIDIP